MFGLIDADIEMIRDVFQSYPEIKRAVIFGSRAMGNYKPGSDVDLALQGDSINSALAGAIGIALNERLSLPYKFDIIAYTKELNADLKAHIDIYGKIFYQKN
ncbi:MAG: nucleotidyltransferase domain-containing protein [Chlamydiales bacterium]|nr:nucleotidyltransferase domain-containing protein [Chlamydiales bacterium]